MLKWIKSKAVLGGFLSILGGVLHLVVAAKATSVSQVATEIITGQQVEALTAIGMGLGAIGIRHGLWKAQG